MRIDKSLASLNIGKEIVDAFNCDKIKIKDKQIVEQLPEADYIHIIDRISKHKPLVVIMSNLARWLTDEECSELIDNLRSVFQRLNTHIHIKVYLRINAVLKEEKGRFLRFLDKFIFVHFLSLKELIAPLKELIQSKQTKAKVKPDPETIAFIHPKNNEKANAHWEYYRDFLHDTDRFAESIATIPLDEFKLLYEKAYWHQKIEFPAIDYIWRTIQGASNDKIEYLEYSLNYAFQSWYSGKFIDKGLEYSIPKQNPKKERRKVLLSPIDSIVEMKIIADIGPEIENIIDAKFRQGGPVSLGNRLDLKENSLVKKRNLFKYWPKQFRLRYFTILQQIQDKTDGYIVNIDVSDFYPSIPHQEMMKIIEKYLPKLSNFQKHWINDFLKTGEMSKDDGKGIPQGPPLSHVLANLYLYDKLDSKIIHGFLPKFYTRYVDDIVYVASSKKDAETFYKWIDHVINPLVKNKDKSYIVSNSEYLNTYKQHEIIELIRIKVEQVIQKVYLIAKILLISKKIQTDDDYRLFSSVLKQIGLNIPWKWIKLKAENPYYLSYIFKDRKYIIDLVFKAKYWMPPKASHK
ncbi:RNA-directed DNA polymerase (reverse transcriptase) domain protein [Candidatus Magnetoovum chiemensis]|nr:RNA-directed DNA polymerase (reverse transcriptase) domain protein [Candidatus Magnetoovum chiemensis]